MEEKPFRLDHPQFESMTDAFLHILGHYQLKGNPHTWEERPSGLIYSKEVPGFLFRGECGLYPTTTPSVARLRNCRQLLKAEVMQLAQISDWIAAHLCEEREGLNREQAFALLQHYGNRTNQSPHRVVSRRCVQCSVVRPAKKPWNASPLFSQAAHAYDQLAAAEKKTDRVTWERKKETDGRTADDVMQRLWKLLEEIRQSS
jgi:hypothetical protein